VRRRLPFVEPVVSDRVFFTVSLGERQLADSEETFDVCDKNFFGPASLREPLRQDHISFFVAQ